MELCPFFFPLFFFTFPLSFSPPRLEFSAVGSFPFPFSFFFFSRPRWHLRTIALKADAEDHPPPPLLFPKFFHFILDSVGGQRKWRRRRACRLLSPSSFFLAAFFLFSPAQKQSDCGIQAHFLPLLPPFFFFVVLFPRSNVGLRASRYEFDPRYVGLNPLFSPPPYPLFPPLDDYVEGSI